jgi:predicted transcriptional regulator
MQILEPEIDREKILEIIGNKKVRPIIIQLMQRNITAQEMIRIYKMPSTTVYRSLKLLVDSGLVRQFRKRVSIHDVHQIINCYKLKFNNIIVRIGNAGLVINFE